MRELACASGVDLLMEYLEGTLPATTVAALDGHVAGCARCQAFIASYLATPRILREATDATLPAPVQSSLLAWLRERRDRDV
jgi:anti-sigma factor RsiW